MSRLLLVMRLRTARLPPYALIEANRCPCAISHLLTRRTSQLLRYSGPSIGGSMIKKADSLTSSRDSRSRNENFTRTRVSMRRFCHVPNHIFLIILLLKIKRIFAGTVFVPGDNSLDKKAFSRRKKMYHAMENNVIGKSVWKMGLQFGKLPIRIRRIVYYSLAPEEQRAWAKSLTHGLPNLVDRIMYSLPTVLPGFIMSAVIYKWSGAAYERHNRKDPKLYENDK